jgi:hypothetical protein
MEEILTGHRSEQPIAVLNPDPPSIPPARSLSRPMNLTSCARNEVVARVCQLLHDFHSLNGDLPEQGHEQRQEILSELRRFAVLLWIDASHTETATGPPLGGSAA